MDQAVSGQTIPNPREDAGPSVCEDVEKINKALKSYAHADARWWSYSATHRTFEIVVGDPSGNGNIVLCLAGCDHIAGPVEWKNQKLEAKWIGDAQGKWHFTIADEVAGFRAVGDELRSSLLIR